MTTEHSTNQPPALSEWVAWVERVGDRWAATEEIAIGLIDQTVPPLSSDKVQNFDMGSYDHIEPTDGGHPW